MLRLLEKYSCKKSEKKFDIKVNYKGEYFKKP